MTDQSIREELYEKDKTQLEEDMSPFGFITDGMDDSVYNEKESGLVWNDASQYDEYGMPHSPWQWEQRTYNRDNGPDPTWWRQY
jgi:hypothetical protein